MSVLRRELDAYERALAAYRRKYGKAVREQNQALEALQRGERFLVPSNVSGQYLIAKSINDQGDIQVETHKTGGFLGMGRKTVPTTVYDTTGYNMMPQGPTPEVLGSAPVKPDVSMMHLDRPSLASVEGGLVNEVLRGRGVLQESTWRPPRSIALEMAKRKEEAVKAQEEYWRNNPPVYDTPGP